MNRHYVTDPKRLRPLMAKFNALVGGTVPLDFFSRSFPLGRTFNLFLSNVDGLGELQRYFEKEGYKCNDNRDDGEGHLVVKYSTSRPGNEIHLGLWCSPDPPIKVILEKYQYTALANFFSWNKAYSLFPLYSFIHHTGFRGVSDASSTVDPECFATFPGINVTLLDEAYQSQDSMIHQSSFLTPRRPGDNHTWMISFSTSGITIETEKTQPDFVLEHQVFSVLSGIDLLLKAPRRFKNQYPYASDTYKSDVLKYTYTVSHGWNSWLDQIAHYRMLEELHKLPLSNRPGNFDEFVSNPKERWRTIEPFDKPASWQYIDSEIPSLFEQWKTTHCGPSG